MVDGKTEKDNIPSEHVITLNNKQFITHRGLLWMAHNIGVKSIVTQLVNDGSVSEAKTVIFKAQVTMADETTFTGYGDANSTNVNSMVSPHLMRMAETRAVNRALRLATNCGMTSAEELGGENDGKKDHSESS